MGTSLIFQRSLVLSLTLAMPFAGACGGDPPYAPLDPIDGMDSGVPDEDAQVNYPRDPFEVTGQVQDSNVYPADGLTVEIYDASLELLDTGTTDADGRFSLSGNRNQLNFIRVLPTDMDMGAVWPVEPTGTPPWELGSVINLPKRQNFEDQVDDLIDPAGNGDIPVVLDNTSAIIGVNYNSGGPHAYVGGYGPVVKANGVVQDLAYIVDQGSVIQLKNAVIPPTCPTKLDDICRMDSGGGRYVWFPNVSPNARIEISTTSVPNMTCSMRHNAGKPWPMFPDTQTIAIADCGG